jgi:hypothetical protein
MSQEPIDEVVPREIAEAERALDNHPRRWLDRAVAAIGLSAGWTLLLPWDYSRRLGLQVWRLGVEEHPMLGLLWAVGFAAAGVALVVRSRSRPAGIIAISISGAAAALFTGFAWQQTGLPASSETWPGPGPSVALTTGLLWLLACAVRLLAERVHPAAEWHEDDLRNAVDRLRRTRSTRPADDQPPIVGPE